MTRTQRRRDTAQPTRDGKHNPICTDNCEDCQKKRGGVSEKSCLNGSCAVDAEW